MPPPKEIGPSPNDDYQKRDIQPLQVSKIAEQYPSGGGILREALSSHLTLLIHSTETWENGEFNSKKKHHKTSQVIQFLLNKYPQLKIDKKTIETIKDCISKNTECQFEFEISSENGSIKKMLSVQSKETSIGSSRFLDISLSLEEFHAPIYLHYPFRENETKEELIERLLHSKSLEKDLLLVKVEWMKLL